MFRGRQPNLPQRAGELLAVRATRRYKRATFLKPQFQGQDHGD